MTILETTTPHDQIEFDDSVDILMVDDDIEDVYITKRRMEESSIGNRFLFELDPTRVFDRLSEYFADPRSHGNVLLLLAASMSKLSGFELLEMLRQNESYSSLPIIMLCSSGETVDIDHAYELGADGCLAKPIQFLELFRFMQMKESYGQVIVMK